MLSDSPTERGARPRSSLCGVLRRELPLTLQHEFRAPIQAFFVRLKSEALRSNWRRWVSG